MAVSRRQFFKGIGGLMLASNLFRAKYADAVNGDASGSPGQGEVEITWLGHGGFHFKSVNGKTILLDPWLHTNPKVPGKYKKPGCFGKVDFILWTHGHVDHFMLTDAKKLVAEYRPKVVAPWELSFFIKSQIPEARCQTFVLGNKGATSDFEGVKITMTEAYHSAGAQLTGFEGVNKFVGEASGYIIEFENGFKVYHAGDTALMGDMKTIIGDFHKPDMAILPIGGVFTMGPKEAAFACKLIGAQYVIPEHFGTFPVLEQSADPFVKELKKVAPDTKPMVLECGETLRI